MALATMLGHFGRHQSQYMEHTVIRLVIFYLRKWEIKECFESVLKRWNLGTLLFSLLASVVFHLCCWSRFLRSVSTLAHFFLFLTPESFGSRKMRKSRTRVLRIVPVLESLYLHSNCWGVCYRYCPVTVQTSSSVTPSLLSPAGSSPKCSQSSQCTSRHCAYPSGPSLPCITQIVTDVQRQVVNG